MKEIILNNIATTVTLAKQSKRLPTEAELLHFEKALGYTLPADYKEFLLKYNGGVCELKNIIVPVSGYLCDLFGLYPDNFETELMTLKLPQHPELTELWGALQFNLLPIGEVDSGDLIALQFYEDKTVVIVLDHEDEEMKVELTENSFTEFLTHTTRE
ncbi:SMI1/KNR4 family protein [Niabella hibiscisoli]|uniref:SMI1/KNR4 family protein n=1 Tax=Niabella hibiscisoli TaxID=1825928 RepID=UPI001F106743|nr:SMI1/KNR4 family protein [Niabella hibiscisoli]MCH5717115.1 SMI1/KNR4 family protein [Niabella hibiscisoli]